MKKWVAWIVMLIIVAVLFGTLFTSKYFEIKGKMAYFANMPEPDYPVTVVEAKPTDWVPAIEAIGFIEPNQGVTVTTEVAGVIKSLEFDSGMSVKKGQRLVALDSDVEEANLKSSQARLPAAKAKFIRYQDLYKKGSISKEAFDGAQADYFSLSADIESLKATIDRRIIKAPFAGDVGLRNVFLGEYIQPGTDIVRLEDTSLMKLRFTIPQTDLSDIHIGQDVDIAVDAYPDAKFQGKISAIEPAVNYQSGLIQVQADIPNNAGRLRSGMFARANIILPTLENQVVLPQFAITYTLYGDNVYVLYEDDEGVTRVRQSVVKTGERKRDVIHVLDGVKPGDRVVTTGQVRLSNDVKVRIVENDALKTPAETPML
ncbi:efflux RND transporter periplasmic adaptor subunit [Photobacterium halotolerans]|uniref:Efflux RND transporter periplasmic adaptor subunit n=1 Tax=Photobacterium halotolerans TaxID=265726 RepID=A0A7X5BKQ3_9GAMM|nr:efflux RND transporter periplasmic adaptor subunit [Photobacterium halotolerans]NAW64542.1 efflux RND transporter periplasmic adaptor subunit [Photobacterium halotolerans]NAW86203.1 efflux RND transporter periplasmic adaptor subunit [Photobacterium halotolerans]NAX46713.1 efflux RND transporter periplasmic adaptor subunit [Photobacterium halotolerans]